MPEGFTDFSFVSLKRKGVSERGGSGLWKEGAVPAARRSRLTYIGRHLR